MLVLRLDMHSSDLIPSSHMSIVGKKKKVDMLIFLYKHEICVFVFHFCVL